MCLFFFFFFQAEDGIRDYKVTGVQTCALPIWWHRSRPFSRPPHRGRPSWPHRSQQRRREGKHVHCAAAISDARRSDCCFLEGSPGILPAVARACPELAEGHLALSASPTSPAFLQPAPPPQSNPPPFRSKLNTDARRENHGRGRRAPRPMVAPPEVRRVGLSRH